MTKRPQKPESPEFVRFWAAYPERKPNPRYEAWRVFDRLTADGEDSEALIGAAGRYAAECRAKGIAETFVTHARTWLSQRRFADYPAPEAAAAESSGAVPDLRKTPIESRLNGVMTAIEQRAWLVAVRVDGDRAVIVTRSRVGADKVRTTWGDGIARALDVAQVDYEVQR